MVSSENTQKVNTPRENTAKEPFKRDNLFTKKMDYRKQRFAEDGESNVTAFGGTPIGIFKNVDLLQSPDDSLKTWTKLQQHELRLKMSQAPRNYFEKMAYWTEEGKVWHFPIDNEQGKLKFFVKFEVSFTINGQFPIDWKY